MCCRSIGCGGRQTAGSIKGQLVAPSECVSREVPEASIKADRTHEPRLQSRCISVLARPSRPGALQQMQTNTQAV